MAKKLILVDTNFLILAMANWQNYGQVLKKIIKSGKMALSVIVIAEFLAGANKEEERVMLDLVDKFEVIDIDKEVATAAGQYRKKFKKLKRKVYLPDCLIAASCKVNDLSLLTLNKKDYPMTDIDFFNPNDFGN